MKTIYIVRHGETLFNQEKRLQGWMDSPLSERGIEQVKRVAKALAPYGLTHALISPLGRARQTSEIICNETGACSQETPDLREVSFGDFEGNTLTDLNRMFPGQWEARQADKWNYCPPGGEANKDAVPRALAVLKRIDDLPDGEQLLVVAHFAINRILISLMCGLEPDDTVIMNVPHEVIYRARGNNGNWEISHRDLRNGHNDFHPGWIRQIVPENLPTGG